MTPLPAAAAPGWRQIARGLYANALDIFPPEAFEEDVVRRRFLGREQIILSEPQAIRRILVDNPENYGRTAATMRILRPVLGNGLLLAEGAEWRRQRRILAPAFAPRTLPLVARHAALAAERAVERLAAAERPIDLLAELQYLTLEVAGRALFSLETERFAAPMRRLLIDYGADLGRPSPLDIILPRWLPSPRDFLRRRFRRRWRALLAQIIAERRRRGPAAPGDLFDLIAATRDPETGEGFSPAGLADEVATLIVAGHETTALALFWSLYLLCEAPAAMARLHAEAAPLDLGPEGAAESLPRLVYTRAVVEEALRLYPPAFAIARQARAPDRAGGIAIPAHAVILIAPWVLHRHRRLWHEPERFDPARFLPTAPRPDRFRYLPFGVGPRTCIGAQFALVEASLVLARLVQAFAIERIGEERVRPVGVVTTRPDPAPLFRLRPRDGTSDRRRPYPR
ncbi:MAG TPA: cytochrome P450 [Stellaceae bacterium]|nr:cytochrome P450 [Stellaceae bacterium]